MSFDENQKLIELADQMEMESTENKKIIELADQLERNYYQDVDLSETEITSSQFNNLHNTLNEKMFKITRRGRSYSRKFKCAEEVIDIELDLNITDYSEASPRINTLFEQLYAELAQPLNDNQQIRMNFEHDLFSMPITIPFMRKKDLTPQLMLDHFSKVVQSYKKRCGDDEQAKYKFNASIIIAEIPSGGHKHKNIPQVRRRKARVNEINFSEVTNKSFYEYCVSSKAILPIYNDDNLCLLHAVLVGKAISDNEKNVYLLAKKNNRKLKKRVIELAKQLNVKDGPCAIDLIKKIEDLWGSYQIMVIDNQDPHNMSTLYLNKDKEFKKFIYLSFTNNHFNVITSMTAFLKKSYYCHQCKIGYAHTTNHICSFMCQLCLRGNCCKTKRMYSKMCTKCNLLCNSEICHRVHSEYVCKVAKTCNICNHKKHHNHVCGFNQKWCFNCKKSVSLDHQCFILTDDQKKAQFKWNTTESKTINGYIFFDYETYQGDLGKHIPNLIMAQTVCSDCLNSKKSDRCADDLEKHVFYNNDDFCKWLFNKEHKKYIALAHNLKGNDGAFIMQYIHKTLLPRDRKPKLMVNGTKLISLTWRSLKLIDSYSFMPMSLEKLPKTFDLHELKKGYFPHLFNLPANQDYIGPYPEKSYYQPEYFSLDKKKKFDEWYDKVKSSVFNFKIEFHDYCWSDVQVLTEACLSFRKIILEQTKRNEQDTGIEPFASSVTIASLCNLIFRRNFMKKNSLAIIPEKGYNAEQKNSNKCLSWLKYLSTKHNYSIQHSRNKTNDSIGGEKRIGPYLLDGYCARTNTIFEFHGCLFHACPKCYPNPNTWNSLLQKTIGFIRLNHNKRIAFIKNNMPNSIFVEIWECEFDELCKNDLEFKEFIKINPIHEPLLPRDALYGGRTNAFKLHHACDEDTRIHYFDFTSVYPYVQKIGKYPVGHPSVLTENFNYSTYYFGLIKCIILPPKKLYIPVLPARINNKLVFTLCSTCATMQNQDICQHHDDLRALTGTWVSEELYKAVECGYKIIKYIEVWHWTNTEQYDGESGGLFTEYINQAIREKQEASGYPANAVSDHDKDLYIDEYFKKEGILLRKEHIEKNSGKRQVAKLKANSQWGYLAMKTNKIQHKLITEPHEWYNMLSDKQYTIHDVDLSNENFIHVKFTINNDLNSSVLSTNLVLAAFVTAYGRLKLLTELHKLQERVLYCDTDSIFFTYKEGDYMPELGDYLGDFTNELDPSDGDYIQEFISAGPKNYGYVTNTGKSHITVKGFTLNYLASKTIRYDSIKEIVLEDQSKKLMVDQYKFSREKSTWNVFTEKIKKQYGFVYDKRILLDDLTTLPYGYSEF